MKSILELSDVEWKTHGVNMSDNDKRNVSNSVDITLNDCDIVYINLETSKDRNNHMKAQFEEQGLGKNVKRYDGVNGHKLDINAQEYDKYLFNNKIKYHSHSDMRQYFNLNESFKGHFGCYLSHLNVLTEFLNRGNKNRYLLVFEDDTILCDFSHG